MLRAALGLVFLSILLASTPARAEDPPRRELYTALTLGPTFLAGSVDYASGTYSYRDSFAGAGGDLRFAMGYGLADGLALALGVDTVVSGGHARVPNGSRDFFLAWTLGPQLDWYPNPTGPAHVELGVGYVVSGFSGGGSYDSSGKPSEPGLGGDGVAGHAAAGYAFRSHSGFAVGPLFAVSALRTHNSAARTTAGSVALLLQLAWF